jgi:hypothetical protein
MRYLEEPEAGVEEEYATDTSQGGTGDVKGDQWWEDDDQQE